MYRDYADYTGPVVSDLLVSNSMYQNSFNNIFSNNNNNNNNQYIFIYKTISGPNLLLKVGLICLIDLFHKTNKKSIAGIL